MKKKNSKRKYFYCKCEYTGRRIMVYYINLTCSFDLLPCTNHFVSDTEMRYSWNCTSYFQRHEVGKRLVRTQWEKEYEITSFFASFGQFQRDWVQHVQVEGRGRDLDILTLTLQIGTWIITSLVRKEQELVSEVERYQLLNSLFTWTQSAISATKLLERGWTLLLKIFWDWEVPGKGYGYSQAPCWVPWCWSCWCKFLELVFVTVHIAPDLPTHNR